MKETGYKGFTVWLTGPSGAGKSYLADGLKRCFQEMAIPVEVFDGDTIRKNLYPDIGFTAEARRMHNKVVINHAKLMTKHGIPNIVSLISPFRDVRDKAREDIGNFVEVLVDSTKEIRIQRDPKGLYARAISGEITNLTGYDGVYEPPLAPEVTVRSHEQTLEEEVEAVISKCRELGFIRV
ncbi:MAG: adenylyl-sulfate kinase [Candidatus Thermoplasmatota archaeon]|nr:adenylyl-sulfate kinase [Candidatus Thermoplasmatota archaeon]